MSAVAELADALLKGLGDNADDASVTQFINTGYPPLNYAISGNEQGGLPFGRMVEMFGESSSGKTALATQWMVEAQRMGGCAIFIDWERSFDVELAKDFGLNTDRPYWIYFKPKTWEEGNTIAARACQLIRDSKAIPDDAPILVVFDSIASAIPKSMLTDAKGKDRGIDELTMNDTTALSRVSSTTLKVMAQHAENFNSTFLYLNQVRLKVGIVFGDPRTTPGGKAMEFYATARLSLGRDKIFTGTGADKEFVGQKINIEVTKSKLTKPFKKAALRMMYDDIGVARFDYPHSLLEYLIDNKLITYSQPYVTWTDGKKYNTKVLAAKINTDGTYAELVALLPK